MNVPIVCWVFFGSKKCCIVLAISPVERKIQNMNWK
jgi:hypothetical protein